MSDPLFPAERCRGLKELHRKAEIYVLRISSFQCFVKRAFDIIISSVGLLLLLPLIILILLMVRLESPGPVLCRHRRYNSVNSEFEILRFRTEIFSWQKKTLNGSLCETQFTTGFGRILRRSGINRIPELMSVLRGEMSIVGSHLFANTPGDISPPLHLGNIRPGIIALTHIYGEQGEPDGEEDEDIFRRVKCDRYYIENYSLLLDAKIIVHAFCSKESWL